MKYYVVSDVHGYYTYLMKALTDAGFFDEAAPGMLVICGDLLDRGNEAKQLIEFALQLMKEGRLIYVRGNHEDLFVQCLQEIARGDVYKIASGMSHHYINKTWDSLLQVGEMSEAEACRNPNELVRRVMESPFYRELLPRCVDYSETPRHVFTHGWIPCHTEGFPPYTSYQYNSAWRDADAQEWRKARWLNGIDMACTFHVTEPHKTVVCGHWHASYGHCCINGVCSEWGKDAVFAPFCANGILAIDACTPRSLMVNCILIEE